MSSLIAFLESAGHHGRASASLLPVDPAIRSALLSGDVAALSREFGDTRAMWCIVAKDDPQPQDEPQRDDEPAREPEREPDDKPN